MFSGNTFTASAALLVYLLLFAGSVPQGAAAETSWSVPDDCAHVSDVSVTETSTGVYTFAVAVSSTETGWDKYADAWRIIDTDTMDILGTRELLHPHVTEQPFTRSLPEVEIPSTVQSITIEARDSLLGYCGETIELGWSDRDSSWTITSSSSGTVDESTIESSTGPSTGISSNNNPANDQDEQTEQSFTSSATIALVGFGLIPTVANILL